jgi:hypothetical protein
MLLHILHQAKNISLHFDTELRGSNVSAILCLTMPMRKVVSYAETRLHPSAMFRALKPVQDVPAGVVQLSGGRWRVCES